MLTSKKTMPIIEEKPALKLHKNKRESTAPLRLSKLANMLIPSEDNADKIKVG